MTFLNPILAGVGLLCVALPIVIHILMRRKRKPIAWGAMRFLLEAYQQQRKRMKLEQVLLLASRCLVVALIALALGRPLLGSGAALAGRGAVTLYLLVDNSLAASALDDAGKPALERHKARAAELLRQIDPSSGDRVAVVALGGPARAAVDPPSSDAGAVTEVVKGLAPTDSAADLPGAISLIASNLSAKESQRGSVVVAVLSDFLVGSADTERKLSELGPRVTMLASNPGAGATNVSIVNAEPERPVVVSRAGAAAGSAQVRVTLRRSGPGVREGGVTTVRLSVQADSATGKGVSVPAGQFSVRWQPGQSERAESGSIDLGLIAKQVGGGAGSVILAAAIDSDAIEGDNTWRRPIEVRRALKVGLVSPRRLGGTKVGVQQFESADWIRLALEPSEAGETEVVEIEPGTLDAARLAGLDAALVVRPDSLAEGAWRRLRTFADQGGFVLVFPAPTGVQLWTDAMLRDMGLPWVVSREVRAWPQGVGVSGATSGLLSVIAPELPDLARPVRVFKSLIVEGAGVPLLKTSDGVALLVSGAPGSKTEGESGRGSVAMMAAALDFDWTDLQSKPLMVPLMWELAKQGIGAARGSWSALAGETPRVPSGSVELRGTSGTARVAGERSEEAVRNSGVWRALDDRGALRGLVAVNADPAGGRADGQPESAIAAWLAGAGANVKWMGGDAALGGGASRALARPSDSMRLVLPLLLGALALAIVELAIARWFSHATVPGAPRGEPGGAA